MTAETSTAVQLRPSGRLAITDDQDYWTPEQYAGLKALGISGATVGDLSVFFHYCRRTQLDPFSRQIHFIKRRERVGNDWVDKWTIQVAIDGFRVMRDRVAARTSTVAEFEDTLWYDADGCAYKVWLSADAPAACQVVLIKHTAAGQRLRFPAVLRTAAYMQVNKDGVPVSQWKSQADHMIEKCCEAFATRRAYPNDFSGVYIEEEMGGRTADVTPSPAPVRRVTAGEVLSRGEPPADPDPENIPQAQPERPVTAQEVNDHFKRLGYGARDKPEVLKAAAALAGRKLPLPSIADLTGDQLAEVAERLARCDTKEDLGELWALIVESQGGDETDQAGGDDG